MTVVIRPEAAADAAAVRAVNTEAFGRPDEARLVERLRERARPYLGLVAVDAAEVVGHIVFAPVTLGFYPRFGFVPARPLGLMSEPPFPDEAFMVAELTPGALRGRRGVVLYSSDYGEPR